MLSLAKFTSTISAQTSTVFLQKRLSSCLQAGANAIMLGLGFGG